MQKNNLKILNMQKEENKMSEKSHVISTLVEHKPGVLQNVASLLNRRGFNIDSITVGTSEERSWNKSSSNCTSLLML